MFKSSESNYFIVVCILTFFSFLPGLWWLYFGVFPDWFLREKGVVETIGASACFAAAIVFFSEAICGKKTDGLLKVWLILLAVMSLCVAGEEVSWGQHIFGFKVPASIRDNNFQREFNLHNSSLIQNVNNFYSLMFMKLLTAYLLLLPIFFKAFNSLRKPLVFLKIPIPSLYIAIIVLFVKNGLRFNHYAVYDGFSSGDIYRVGEMYECIMECCLLILAIECLLFSRRNILNVHPQQQVEKMDMILKRVKKP
ncbi:MAG TPA: hypothetical protein VJ624_01720 [Thermodesulfobacteriota bacterium]|nr:hypothetical protein [Thermodesulfobacteriota bacterium]